MRKERWREGASWRRGGRERERERMCQLHSTPLLSEASKGEVISHLVSATLCALCDLVMTNIPLCLHIQS